MMDEHEQAELKAILEDTTTEEPDTEPQKSTRKGKASGSIKVELHYVQENILNFAKRYPDMAYSAKSVFQDKHLDNEHLEAVLNRDLPPELNHFIRWLLKIPYAERTEWQDN